MGCWNLIEPKHVVYKQGCEGKASIIYRGEVQLQVTTPESIAEDEFGFARLDTFTEGESFGDAVLAPGPSKRRETVITQGDATSYFLVLPKDKYLNRQVGDRSEEIALRIKTLKRNPALQDMSDELLNELAQRNQTDSAREIIQTSRCKARREAACISSPAASAALLDWSLAQRPRKKPGAPSAGETRVLGRGALQWWNRDLLISRGT